MKKILAFLGIISIMSNVISTVTAVTPYHNLKEIKISLLQFEREENLNYNKIDYSYNVWTGVTTLFAVFTSSFWIKIINLYNDNKNKGRSKSNFINMLIRKMAIFVEIDSGVNEQRYLRALAKEIYENLLTINSIWDNSDKLSMIKIEVSVAKKIASDWFSRHKISYKSNYVSTTIVSN